MEMMMMRKAEKTAMERRKYPIGTDPRKELRQERAEERHIAREKRSTEEQLELISRRPGKNERELARLEK
jgi:hypothetical protein